MISPDIKDLMKNMDSRYTLVVTAAKRARQLTGGAEPLTKYRSDKPVTLAIHEIAEGKVDYFRDALRLPYEAASNYRERSDPQSLNNVHGYSSMMYDDSDGYSDEDAGNQDGGGYMDRYNAETGARDDSDGDAGEDLSGSYEENYSDDDRDDL